MPRFHRLPAILAPASEPAFDPTPGAPLEFGLDERFQQDDGTPPFLRRPGDEIVEVVGGVSETQPAVSASSAGV